MDLLYANDRPGEYPDSYYSATANRAEAFPGLDTDTECEICVVGGGFTGLSAALHLAERGHDVVLLEAHRAGWGASGRNGGQAASGQRTSQRVLEKLVGNRDAAHLWRLAVDAVQLVRDLVARHHIACDLRDGVLHADLSPGDFRHTRDEVAHLRNVYGHMAVRLLERDEIAAALGTNVYYGGALDMSAAHLHPLNYALGLASAAAAAGARIFERSPVAEVVPGERPMVRAGAGTVNARHVVLACNGYLGGLDTEVSSRVMPINNFIVATRPLGKELARELIRDDVAVADSKFVVNYYRLSADNRLLFGGGESYGYRFPADIRSKAQRPMLEVFPQLEGTEIEFAWGGTLAITRSRMPHFARPEAGIVSASGYSGHGVAMATLAGRVIADLIDGRPADFEVLESVPTPRFPGGQRLRWPLLVLAMLWFSMRDRF